MSNCIMLLKRVIVDKKFIIEKIKIVLNNLLMLLYSIQVSEKMITRINYFNNKVKIIYASLSKIILRPILRR